MLTNEIITSTNNKFHFNISMKHICLTSGEYDSEFNCINDMCQIMSSMTEKTCGQVVCRHEADEWQEAITAVVYTLVNNN